MTKNILFSIFVLIASVASAASSLPDFQSREGLVIGQTTSTGVVFKNVPFAQPPTGPLRWKAPRPPLARTSAWDGSRIDVKCAQVAAWFSGVNNSSEFGQPTGSEDCLYLNIWKPNATSAKKRPVFVWFHGGSNRQGFASDPLYNGESLASITDAIVITVNYRLGVFGALYHDALKTEDRADSSGNYVTLDMIRSLAWIRENAAALGADVNRITVGGQSAGCMNVWGLIQSPLAKGLFSQAYCSSGFPNNYPSAIAKRNANDVIKKALVYKKHASEKSADDVLEKMSPAEINKFLYSLSTEDILALSTSFIPIQHIADGYVLPGEGLLALMTGSYNSVPLMVNSMASEGSFFFLQPLARVSKLDFWSMLTGQTSTKPIDDLVDSPTRFAKFKEESSQFTYGMNQLIDSILAYRQWTPGPIYRMRFEWTPQAEPWHSALGACHGLDLPFLFHETDMGKNHYFSYLKDELKDPATLRLSDHFLAYFKGFLHTGDPNAYIAKQNLPTWSPWIGVMPSNMTFSHDDISSKYHYLNPLVGTYALTKSILDLSQATQNAVK